MNTFLLQYGFFAVFILFSIIPVVILVTAIKRLSPQIRERLNNHNTLSIPVLARVISKRPADGENKYPYARNTNYFALFEFSNREQIELSITVNEYMSLNEGNIGLLTFKSRQMVSFQNDVVDAFPQ